jgi:predicted membrane-bound spermidine synthase
MRRYIPLILIEGAAVMAVELCGAKQLSPLYGGSLFVWAAILAVTLGALAFGYYYGGILSGKDHKEKKLFNVILWASATILLMPFLALYVIPSISYIDFKLAVILSACLLIFAPIFFLGCTTPLLIRINTLSAETAGLVSGKIYAISTVGGIVSTLLCGFFLIPALGLKLTLISFAIILFLTAAIILKFLKPTYAVPFYIALLLSLRSAIGQIDPSVKYHEYGILGDVAVKDEDSVRKLFINRTVQTEMHLGTKRSVSDYMKCIDSIVPQQEQTQNALLLGLGGGLLANLIEKKNFKVDAVEFDPRVTEAAKNYFELSSTVNCFTQDARTYINSCERTYDLVVFDLFKAEEQPVHTITVESFKKVVSFLKPGGSVIINWHGYLSGELGKGTDILIRTLNKAGLAPNSILGKGTEDHRNTILLCKLYTGIHSNDNELVNTDDKPVLELANAKANLRWRQNYLRFYQSSR